MNEKDAETFRRAIPGITEEQILEVSRLTRDAVHEYFMERRYLGVSHAEGLRRAKSRWTSKENK